MDTHNQFVRSVNLFFIQLSSIKNYLSSAKAQTYSESNALEFIKCIEAEIKNKECEVGSLINSTLSNDVKLSEIRTFQRELPILVSELQHIRNAQIKWLPWSLVGAIRDIAVHIAPENKILVTGTLHSTYRILPPNGDPDDLEEYKKFAIIEIPFLHRRNSLLHVLIGHEIFHLIAPKFITINRNKALRTVKDKLQPQIDVELKKLQAYFDNINEQSDWLYRDEFEKIKNSIQDKVPLTHKIWERSLIEIFCDLGCLYYFGPSVIFALTDIFNIHGETVTNGLISQHHPDFTYRLSILVNQLDNIEEYKNATDTLINNLKKSGNSKYADSFANRLNELRTLAGCSRPQFEDTKYSTAYEVLDDHISDIWNFLRKNMNCNSYCWFTSIDETIFHLNYIKRSIPSGSYSETQEIAGEASNYSGILLASWIHALEKFSDELNKAELIQYYETYLEDCNILLKSIDDSNSIREFKKRKNEQ